MVIQGYHPREDQRPVFDARARFLVLDAGRRWGKTITGLNWQLQGICAEGGESWWIAPIYPQSKMVFRKLLSAARRGGADRVLKDVSHSELRIEFINGAVAWYKSGDNPDNLRGEGIRRAIVDEAARVKREVWEEVLRPAVSDTGGRILFISTPKGKNWFYELWCRGQDPLQPEYESWKYPTSSNPKVSSADIEQARQTLPVDVFSQEYLAEFLENQAGVFRNVKDCIGSVRSEPVSGRSYFAGLDLARLTDFTVLTILDDLGHQVFIDRFNLLDWAVQKQRIISTVKRYGAQLLLDSTGIGDPIHDDLRRAGLAVAGYKFTAESKQLLIEALQMAFDQLRIKILDDVVQRNELEIFEYEIGRSGAVRYSAPEGYHDDTVVALALAWWLYAGPKAEPRIRRLG